MPTSDFRTWVLPPTTTLAWRAGADDGSKDKALKNRPRMGIPEYMARNWARTNRIAKLGDLCSALNDRPDREKAAQEFSDSMHGYGIGTLDGLGAMGQEERSRLLGFIRNCESIKSIIIFRLQEAVKQDVCEKSRPQELPPDLCPAGYSMLRQLVEEALRWVAGSTRLEENQAILQDLVEWPPAFYRRSETPSTAQGIAARCLVASGAFTSMAELNRVVALCEEAERKCHPKRSPEEVKAQVKADITCYKAPKTGLTGPIVRFWCYARGDDPGELEKIPLEVLARLGLTENDLLHMMASPSGRIRSMGFMLAGMIDSKPEATADALNQGASSLAELAHASSTSSPAEPSGIAR